MSMWARLFGSDDSDIEFQNDQFRQKRQRFAFRVPPGWVLDSRAGLTSEDPIYVFHPVGASTPQFRMTVNFNVKGKTIEDTIEFAGRWLLKKEYIGLYTKPIRINGQEALSFGYKYPEEKGGLEFERVSILRHGNEYLLQFGSKDINSGRTTFDGILESFQFEDGN